MRAGRVVTIGEVVSELCLGCGARPLELAAQVGALQRLRVPELDCLHDRMEGLLVRCAGVGLSDVRIIAAALDGGALIYSLDSAMARIAQRLGIEFRDR